jgi:ribonuclease Z
VSLGYGLISIREKLKQEYAGIAGQELAAMKKQGIEIQYRVEIPMVVFLGDTSIGNVFEHPDVRTAEVLITECTFFDADHRGKAKAGRHLHVEQFVEILGELKNKHIVLTHVSRRTGIGRAKHLLRKLIGAERMRNIHFLMDFEGSEDGGDIETAGPNPNPDAVE